MYFYRKIPGHSPYHVSQYISPTSISTRWTPLGLLAAPFCRLHAQFSITHCIRGLFNFMEAESSMKQVIKLYTSDLTNHRAFLCDTLYMKMFKQKTASPNTLQIVGPSKNLVQNIYMYTFPTIRFLPERNLGLEDQNNLHIQFPTAITWSWNVHVRS